MDFGLNPEELSTDLLFVVCARCGEERPESAFRAKRQSAGQTKQCIDCRNQRVSHHSRSKVVLQTLRNIALRPSSPGRPATKRTEGDAGLSPPNERSGTQPTSPEKLRQLHTARSLFGESISQPHVVLGTPIPPTQQSSRLFRALAPSPPVQPTTHPLVSHSDPSTLRSSTPGVDYSYLATRFHKGGKDSQDDSLKAGARAKLAVIQRDHRSRRRAGEAVSLTPTISQLGFLEDFEGPGEDGSQDQLRPSGFLDGDGIIKEGDDRGQFSESDIDADDYFNLLLSPARPRRYLKRLGVESDSDLGDEDENDDNDCVDGSPLRHRLRQPSAQLRRGRRGPAPGTGGRPRKSRRQTRSSMPPRRIRSPVIIPPEESAVFHAQDPVWNGDLEACALTGRDKAILREFWTKLDNDQMQFCSRCQECWFQMKIDCDGICARCYRKDEKRRPDEPYFFSADNQLDFGPVPARLPQLTPTEESLIARVHVHVNIMLVRGQQYKYRGHVVHFLREVGLVYNQFPLLPQELNIVLLRPANTSSHAILSRQFTRQFRVRRQPVVIWLDYLRRHHPGYRCVVIDEERLNQLPQDGNVLDAIPQSQVEAADVGPEEDQEAEPDLEGEAAVPDMLAKDTELDALRSILAGESEADSELSTSFQAQAQHELQLPNIRHTPINEFNRSHALLSLAFPCLFPDGRADFVEPRLRSIDYKDYVEHAMRWHDGRFARHPTFRFVAFNTLMRSQARSRSRFFVKQHDGRQQPLTREQLIQALEHSEDPEAQALINSIARHAVSIRGTRPFWNKKRQDLEAYAYNLGCPQTPSEPLGSTLPSTPTSVSTPTDILVLDDGASTPTIADERQIPTSSQCVFPINWDKIRYNGKPVPSIRYRQPHKRTLNSKLQPSAIYKHGAQLTTDGDNKYWLCKYCHIRGHHHTALFSSESTTSVIYHLKHQHKLEDFRYQAALSNPFSMAKGTTNPTSYLGGRRSVFNDLQFKDDFIDWVIDLDLTFRQVTHQRTHEIFTNHLEDIGKILPKSPSALSNWIKEKWVGDAGRRVWLMEKLHVATSKIHISVDAWTSEEGTNYLAVVAHFLDESHKLQTALLDLPPLKGPHSGENLAKALSKVIDFYDISTVIGFFMMDNAGNNDTCIQELAKQYPAIKLQSRLRCVGHMLNLIVKALLFGQGVSKMEQQLRGASDEERFEIWRKQSFIGKLHNFCVWVNRSDQRRELLKQYVLTAYDEGSIECLYTRVLVDGGIRWNSAYAMIERALKLRHAIDLFFLNYNHIGKEYDISQDMLTPQDWIDLEHFLGILKPFKDLTKRMEGRANKAGLEGSHGSLYETIESLDVLFKELQEAGKFADNHPEVVSTYYSYAIDTARVKLEEYFGLTDATPAYRCAVALHPANKFTYFELEWSHNKQWISEAKRVVREVYAQYEEAAAKTGTIGAQPQEKVIDDNDVALDPLQQARKRRQRLAATAASGSRGNKRIKLTSELDEFMARANKADVEVEDPLEWWVCHASDYPILSKMAFDLFSCPAMSAECERVFSQTKKVITDERNRLKSDTVAALECQKHLLRTGMLP
ncbi:hypothetical protein HZS61_002532 [Fusarium oxysporum f. sp. conglutinans]|uniref:BED-type domain-containing protein n=1 Tax=Fusarium oxysporum f. sp. conglutinans TaxID=100902 RepID=A0A8H6GI01_FUSOX|nr:hypothetical protein HZS61_002532 [Fusarium oxysporum f. sp. conglutinans]